MPVRGSADESWSALGVPWREALEMAWESVRDGGAGVAAVLTSGTGDIIGRGRDQRFTSAAPRDLLAHAEMEALAALPARKDRQRDAALYTTLHPCPMCLGAVVVARVGRLHFGALDPTWLGIEKLPDLNAKYGAAGHQPARRPGRRVGRCVPVPEHGRIARPGNRSRSAATRRACSRNRPSLGPRRRSA